METLNLEQAVNIIPDGASLMIGGFMGVGTPERVVDELIRQGKATHVIGMTRPSRASELANS